jgi:hypothetical protein
MGICLFNGTFDGGSESGSERGVGRMNDEGKKINQRYPVASWGQ